MESSYRNLETGLLGDWNIGVLEYWSTGVLEYWSYEEHIFKFVFL